VVLVPTADEVALDDTDDPVDPDATDRDCAAEDPQAHTSTAASASVSREKPISGA
jgi:hypothetical protein